MTPKKLDRYQISLGERQRRFMLVPPDPIQQPDPTVGWKRLRGWGWWALFIIAAMALIVGAAFAGGAL